MESQFENNEQREDFNVWLLKTHIFGKGKSRNGKDEKFIIIKKRNDKYGVKNYCNLYLGTVNFDNWLNERIKEYKDGEPVTEKEIV
jgi:hypothetical protein